MHCRVDKVRNKKEISRRSISSDVARSFLVYCQIKCIYIYISGDGRTNSNTKRLITLLVCCNGDISQKESRIEEELG